jgi:hypothetical protein
MGGGLIGDNLLLNLHQQLLRFGQRDAQIGNLTKTIGSADRHQVETLGLTTKPNANQTQRPFHP